MTNDTAVSPILGIGNAYNLIWLLAASTTTTIAYWLMITNQYSIIAYYGALVCWVAFILTPRGL